MKKINFENGGPKANAETMNDFQNNIEEAIEALYPIGSVYINLTNSTNPSILLGFGTWERIKDKFLYALGDNGRAGDTGGSSSVKLTASQIPTLSGKTNTDGMHYHRGVAVDGTNLSLNNGNVGSGFGLSYAGDRFYKELEITNTNSSHNHNFSITNNSQSNVDTMPPYLKAYMWKRTA